MALYEANKGFDVKIASIIFVMRWIKTEANSIPEPIIDDSIVDVEFDDQRSAAQIKLKNTDLFVNVAFSKKKQQKNTQLARNIPLILRISTVKLGTF